MTSPNPSARLVWRSKRRRWLEGRHIGYWPLLVSWVYEEELLWSRLVAKVSRRGERTPGAGHATPGRQPRSAHGDGP